MEEPFSHCWNPSDPDLDLTQLDMSFWSVQKSFIWEAIGLSVPSRESVNIGMLNSGPMHQPQYPEFAEANSPPR
jgi:hypothetical protein